jgi:hypothetical protein
MRRFNLRNAGFRYNDEDPDGYKSAVADVGGALGASELATYAYELTWWSSRRARRAPTT